MYQQKQAQVSQKLMLKESQIFCNNLCRNFQTLEAIVNLYSPSKTSFFEQYNVFKTKKTIEQLRDQLRIQVMSVTHAQKAFVRQFGVLPTYSPETKAKLLELRQFLAKEVAKYDKKTAQLARVFFGVLDGEVEPFLTEEEEAPPKDLHDPKMLEYIDQGRAVVDKAGSRFDETGRLEDSINYKPKSYPQPRSDYSGGRHPSDRHYDHR